MTTEFLDRMDKVERAYLRSQATPDIGLDLAYEAQFMADDDDDGLGDSYGFTLCDVEVEANRDADAVELTDGERAAARAELRALQQN
jgi:hypothetical protein